MDNKKRDMDFLFNWKNNITGTKKIIIMGIFIALSVLLQILENIFFPPSTPLRVGIPNIVVIIVLEMLGLPSALFLSVVRVFIVGLIMGNFLGVPFWTGLAGAVFSTVAMGMVINKSPDLSLIGVSVIGATVHIWCQILVIYFLLVQNQGIFNLIPYLWLLSIIAGMITGYISLKILKSSLFRRMGFGVQKSEGGYEKWEESKNGGN